MRCISDFGGINRFPRWDGAGPTVRARQGNAVSQVGSLGGNYQPLQPIGGIGITSTLSCVVSSVLYLSAQGRIKHNKGCGQPVLLLGVLGDVNGIGHSGKQRASILICSP